ncbi:hypothetical protein B5M42_001100 [Paenibacillus athensensis]|uniref:Uncharacterized protein n=1 Tax=Paenibacillus athensensis TaxID=1967502 RepID=A0A4Y8Q6Y4_9BACL|nr:hypothetical protein [Paenibacillus athensensis]MCD1257433.1 hypothetical protein [Paenibacillus athensensis]
MNIEQTVEEILAIKRMLHQGASTEEVGRYIEQRVKQDPVRSAECETPALCGANTGGSIR